LGRGRFGEVYRIDDEGINYSVKFFFNDNSFQKEMEEYNTLKRILKEEYSTLFREVYADRKHKILILTFVRGKTLWEYLEGEHFAPTADCSKNKEKPKPHWESYFDILKFEKLITYLEELSETPEVIIHDLHPKNLIYDEDKKRWIAIDFKISKREKIGFWLMIWGETTYISQNVSIKPYLDYLAYRKEKERSRRCTK
jgi:serine/threonine protein kinase